MQETTANRLELEFTLSKYCIELLMHLIIASITAYNIIPLFTVLSQFTYMCRVGKPE
jgi:hypothetical protein